MKKKTVVMAGASGLIGTYLKGYLNEYDLVEISRNDLNLTDKEFAKKYRDSDIVINLSGAPVIQRWTRRNRKVILDSRILTTRKLGCIMKYNQDRERLYLSASAIGIYNDVDIHTEDSTAWGMGFMAEVVNRWEAEVQNLNSKNTKGMHYEDRHCTFSGWRNASKVFAHIPDRIGCTDRQRKSIFLMDSYKGYGQGRSFPNKQQ